MRSLSSLAPKPPSSSSGSRLYPPLPASEESFIHQAIRELQTDPDTINKMYEKFSQQIISDMKRKVSIYFHNLKLVEIFVTVGVRNVQ